MNNYGSHKCSTFYSYLYSPEWPLQDLATSNAIIPDDLGKCCVSLMAFILHLYSYLSLCYYSDYYYKYLSILSSLSYYKTSFSLHSQGFSKCIQTWIGNSLGSVFMGTFSFYIKWHLVSKITGAHKLTQVYSVFCWPSAGGRTFWDGCLSEKIFHWWKEGIRGMRVMHDVASVLLIHIYIYNMQWFK